MSGVNKVSCSSECGPQICDSQFHRAAVARRVCQDFTTVLGARPSKLLALPE